MPRQKSERERERGRGSGGGEISCVSVAHRGAAHQAGAVASAVAAHVRTHLLLSEVENLDREVATKCSHRRHCDVGIRDQNGATDTHYNAACLSRVELAAGAVDLVRPIDHVEIGVWISFLLVHVNDQLLEILEELRKDINAYDDNSDFDPRDPRLVSVVPVTHVVRSWVRAENTFHCDCGEPVG